MHSSCTLCMCARVWCVCQIKSSHFSLVDYVLFLQYCQWCKIIQFLVANKSLDEMRTMYFKFKDSVFTEGGGVVPQCETEVLEKILKETFGETQTLGSRVYPR